MSAEAVYFRRRVAESVLQLIMETDVEGLIGASRHEGADQRTTDEFLGKACWGPQDRGNPGPFVALVFRRAL